MFVVIIAGNLLGSSAAAVIQKQEIYQFSQRAIPLLGGEHQQHML